MVTRGQAWSIACLLVLAVAAFQLLRDPRAEAPLPVLHTLGGEFALESTLGRRVALSEFRGSVVVLNFGFTGCPDVCPTALARMRDALNLAGPGPRPVVPLFVSLDPLADTVERLTPYVRHFHPQLIGLTGNPQDVSAAAAPFKVYYRRDPESTPGSYSISHSSHLYLIDASGRVRATFGEGVPVDQVAEAIRRLQGESETWPETSV